MCIYITHIYITYKYIIEESLCIFLHKSVWKRTSIFAIVRFHLEIRKYFILAAHRFFLVMNFENKLRRSKVCRQVGGNWQNWRRQTTLFMPSYSTLYSTLRCLPFTSYLITERNKTGIKTNSINFYSVWGAHRHIFIFTTRNRVLREFRLHFNSGVARSCVRARL